MGSGLANRIYEKARLLRLGSGRAGTIYLMALIGIFSLSQMVPDKFVSQIAYETNFNRQVNGVDGILRQLRKQKITSQSEMKVEFFFYTNAMQKAGMLSKKLMALGYQVKSRPAASGKDEIVVTGLTPKMKMSPEVLRKWAKQMCTTGYECDCDFDGWGVSLK
jgi:regulator of RNase E activity RraB